jgi:hypothetical protein
VLAPLALQGIAELGLHVIGCHVIGVRVGLGSRVGLGIRVCTVLLFGGHGSTLSRAWIDIKRDHGR